MISVGYDNIQGFTDLRKSNLDPKRYNMYPQKERLCEVKYPFVKVSRWKFLRNTSGKQRRFMGDKGIAKRGIDRSMFLCSRDV
ncbi:uncharacterized protein EAF02_004918 [Botrytis sinoallii]|uniref:uncharacterized protein n=1 Tax=Botrytis sinoallii TaxID=1463999 RepID=UPI0019005D7C|nr:uncharacterized protein EAF02_004918 [Botrytis sinoallii]KAF7884582.1 hypothetical protein EAF02_004918 [Botrytis sinoallii]